MLQEMSFTVEGVAPLLMSNPRMIDPLNEYAIELGKISGKRKKTEADHRRMAELEWTGRIYWRDDIGLYLPGECLQGAVEEAAKAFSLGKACKGAILCEDAAIVHGGPKSFDELKADPAYTDRRAVRVGQSKVMRTRPRVPRGWVVEFDLYYNDEVLNPEQIRDIVARFEQVGLCDYRPKFGRAALKN